LARSVLKWLQTYAKLPRVRRGSNRESVSIGAGADDYYLKNLLDYGDRVPKMTKIGSERMILRCQE
jgi:hypothetical protein